MNRATYIKYGKLFDFMLICFIILIIGINFIPTNDNKYAVTIFMGAGYIFIQKVHSIYIRVFFKDEVGARVPILFSRVGHYCGIIFFIVTIILLIFEKPLPITLEMFMTSATICVIAILTSASIDMMLINLGGSTSAANYKAFYISRLK